MPKYAKRYFPKRRKYTQRSYRSKPYKRYFKKVNGNDQDI